MAGNDKSVEKFNKSIESEVTSMFEQILDYAQIAVPTADVYKALRSKILRVGNNCIRNLKTELKHYDVEFKATSEDIIEVGKK